MHKQGYLGKFSILIMTLFFLFGCQSAPQKNAVASKNNASFDVRTVVSAEETHVPEETQKLNYDSTFSSTDKSVHFVMDISQEISAADLPLVRVTPHYLTEQDAERTAYALFPEADFYEPALLLNPALTKGEIQKKINLWSNYVSEDSLREILGDDVGDNYLSSTANLVKKFIERYSMKYDTAPEGDIHTLCPWKMRKSLEYMYTKEELAEMGENLEDSNDEISAKCYVNEIPYYYTVSTRNKNDYKVNLISAIIYDGESPREIENRIYSAKLCRTQEPSSEQIESIKERATQVLSKMNLGEWQIDQCKIEKQTYGTQSEYYVYVDAVPTFNGIPAIRLRQLDGLRNEDGYAASQYITDANFCFSANGDIVFFRLYTPLDVKEIVTDHVKTMGMNELLERAKEVLELSDAYAYPFGSYLQFIDEQVQCDVTVSEIEYGLTRIKVQDQADDYYYVPAISLKGSVEYVGQESNKTYYVSENPEVLVVINAIDGTVINRTNS